MATKKNTAVKHGDKEYAYYKMTKTIGHEYRDGKRVPIKKQFYGTSKRNAEEKYYKWLKDRENKNKNPADTHKSFGELADFYAENVLSVSADYAQGTKDLYLASYGRFKKKDITNLLSLNISDISAAHIQSAYNNLNVHASSLISLNKFFKGFFKWAALNRYCENPLPAVTMPQKEKNKVKDGIVIWEDGELDTITSHLQGYRHGFLILTANYTGLRISELLGLKYGDFDGNMLHVRRQWSRGGYIDKPKHNSIRDIPIHRALADALEVHKQEHRR